MANKILKTRVQNKCDTAANWKLATNFKPLKGEIILYTDTKQMKVGDGNTLVNNLPFYPSGDDTTYRGTAITGTSTTATAFSNSGIAAAKAGDWYINTSNGNVYQCTVAGNASTAKWVYKGTQAILEDAQHMGVGIWADDVSNGCGAFLTKDGYLDLINTANYMARINADHVFDNQNYALPNKSGTFALTDDVQANPTASSTASLTKLKVGDTVYGLSSGDSSTTVISKTISAWPTATAPVSISFTTDENNKISNKDTFKNIVIQVGVNDKNYACLYPVGYGNIIYDFVSSDNVYKLSITGGVGSMTYTKPAEIAGDNTFTGSNTFSTVKVQTNAQTYTTISPTNISGKSGGASYSLVLPVKTSTLATLDDLSSLFTYANNTLTINI